MSGIKISELNKWSISDVENVPASEILIPVSVNGVTGCLRANVLVNFMKTAGHEMDDMQNDRIDDMNANIQYLETKLNNFMTEMNRKYNELISNQTGIDTSQTTQLNEHSESISNLENENAEQSAQINDLQAAHEWENFNNQNNGSGN